MNETRPNRSDRREAERADRKRVRPTPRRIMMDSMPTAIDDEEYFLHEGETVSVNRTHSQATLNASRELLGSQISPAFDPREFSEAEDNGQRAQALQHMAEVKRATCNLLRTMVVSWTLTNSADGTPLPQPSEPNAFDQLTDSEISYLGYAVMRAFQKGEGDLYDPGTPEEAAEDMEAEPAADPAKDGADALDSPSQ